MGISLSYTVQSNDWCWFSYTVQWNDWRWFFDICSLEISENNLRITNFLDKANYLWSSNRSPNTRKKTWNFRATFAAFLGAAAFPRHILHFHFRYQCFLCCAMMPHQECSGPNSLGTAFVYRVFLLPDNESIVLQKENKMRKLTSIVFGTQ